MGAGRLARIWAVAANTFRETVRERVLYNLLFFAVIMTLSGLLLSQLSIRQDEKIIKDIGLASMELFGTLIAIFIGVGLVAKEIERRSLHALLAKPLSRDEFFLGKFAGLGFTLLVNVVLMSVGLVATLVATGRRADPHLLLAIYPIYLGLLLVVALAVFFSTLTSTVLAAVFTVGMVVAGRYSDVIRNVKEVRPDAPTWLFDFLYYALPNFRSFDFKDKVTHGDPVSLAAMGWVTGYAAAYIGLVLVAGLLAFRSRELT